MSDSYLSHLSLTELSYRGRYLIENLTTLELNGKIGLKNIRNEPAQSLMRKFTHVLQELSVRNEKPDPGFLKGAAIPKAMLGHEIRLNELNRLAKSKKPHLIKFGEKEYLEKSSFKVSLASSFSDPSLNIAQMDDEMRAVYIPHPSKVELAYMDGKKIEGLRSIEITLQSQKDYYIFCSSHIFDIRMFCDFTADSCLFIYDSQEFSNDLLRNLSKKVEIEDHGYNKVSYIDPINPDPGVVPPIEFHKHIKFLYQNEFRHVFIPNHTCTLEKHIVFSMPEVTKYSELVCL